MNQPASTGERIARAFVSVIAVLNGIGTVWIFGLMMLINADIFGRAAFNRPLEGVEEIVTFSIVGIFFLQIGHTLQQGRMTRNTMLIDAVERRSPRLHSALEALLNLVGAAMFLVIFIATIPVFQKAVATGDFYGNIGLFTFPVWPLKLLILVGSLAGTVQYLMFFVFYAISVVAPERAPRALLPRNKRELEAYK